MPILDPDALGPSRTYKLLSAMVVPRPIAWVGTRSREGVANLAPFSFFNVVSNDPPTVMISITSHPDREKDTLRNLRDSGEFTVSHVSRPQFEAMASSSDVVGADVDEFARAGLTAAPADVVAAPAVAGAPWVLECVVDRELEVGSYAMVLGRVVRLHLRDDVLDERMRVDLLALRSIGRLSTRFTEVTELIDP